MEATVDDIRRADGIFIDVYDAHKIGSPELGRRPRDRPPPCPVVGFTQGILGFLVTPYVFTTIDRAADYLGRGSDVASYFLVQIDDGADPKEVCRRIRERLPDMEAYTRDEYAAISIGYWMKRTGLGISFGAATALGLVVGLIIVGQTLYASVLDRLVDFSALKAIGAQERQVRSLILQQALSLAVVGSAAGARVRARGPAAAQHAPGTDHDSLVRFVGQLPGGDSGLPCRLAAAVLASAIDRSGHGPAKLIDRTTSRRFALKSRSDAQLVSQPRYAAATVIWTDGTLVVELRGVSKSFVRGSSTTCVVDDVDLTAGRGECVFLLGPSGSGKSTLLSIIGCVLTADRGEVRILGRDVSHLSRDESAELRRQHIGFVFQRFHLIRGLVGGRKCRRAADARRLAGRPCTTAGKRTAGDGRPERKARRSAEPVECRPVPARGVCPGAGGRSGADFGRRTDRFAGRQDRPPGARTAASTDGRSRQDRHCRHPRSANPVVRRPDSAHGKWQT